MKRLNLLAILLLSTCIANLICEQVQQKNSKEEESEDRDFLSPSKYFKHMAKEFERIEREMNQMIGWREDFTKDANKGFQDIKQINISNEQDKDQKNWVVVTVHFGNEKMKHNDIKIKAKDRNLEGFVDYNDHKLKFFVVRGREFGTSLEFKHESEEGKKDKKGEQKYTRFFSAFSTQMNIIPPVRDLENTKAYFEGDKLIIKLPSAVESKKDWTTINIENSEKPAEKKENASIENLK